MNDFQDKVVLVTGGSSGIGLAVATRFVERGARVALVARNREKLSHAVNALEQRAGQGCAVAFPCDVSKLDALDALARDVRAALGPVDILVNNAGTTSRSSLLDTAPRDVAQVLTTNLVGPAYLTRLVTEHMPSGGAVVTVASLAGMVPLPEEPLYSTSKAGLRFFGRAVAPDLAARGIHVLTVCPGPVDTPFISDVDEVSEIVLSQPMSTAAQVADAILAGLRRRRRNEMAIPARAGALVTIAYVFPRIERLIRPLVRWLGSRAKRRYAALVASRRAVARE